MEVLDFIQSFPERKKQLITGAVSVLAGIAILIGYVSTRPNALSYAKAEAAFGSWEASPLDGELYNNMKQAIQAVPQLSLRYEPTIAQKLINTERLQEALTLANRSLLRVKGDVPFHAMYAQNSLLIEQGSYQKALENAVALKEEMGPSFVDGIKGGALLYAHNLIRIACLHQELANQPGERSAWQDLETLLQNSPALSETILSNFTDKQTNLLQYIAERKKVLN